MNDLRGQRALVTGAGSGVGRAIALRLSGSGVKLLLAGRTQESLDEVARLASASAEAKTFRIELGSEEEIAALAREAGDVDILVHSAGEISFDRLENTDAGDFDRLYRVNVLAPHLLTRALLPKMQDFRGQIVFVNSSAGLNAKGGVGAYASMKHALRGLADSLREEVNERGIRVMSVYLGRTATPMQERVHAAEKRTYVPESLLQPEDVAEIVADALSLPFTAEVTDLRIRPLKKSGPSGPR